MNSKVLFIIKKASAVLVAIAVLLLFTGCKEIFSPYVDPETGEIAADVAEISLLKKSSVKTIYSAADTVYYLMNNGSVLASGNNENALLGQGNTNKYDYVVKVKLPERIKMLTANSKMAVAVSDTNNVYVWGDLSWWGIDYVSKPGDDGSVSMVYEKFSFDEIVSDVALSNNHIVVLTKKGNVYSLGKNNGQLGYDFTELAFDMFYSNFKRVETDLFITDIDSNDTATYLLTVDGELYGCSANKSYELGYVDSLLSVNKLDVSEEFSEITTAGTNIFALTNDGRVFSCGENTNGVLGLDSNIQSSAMFMEIKFDEGVAVKQIIGSDDFNFIHFICEDNRVFACGTNTNGMLLTDSSDAKISAPALVDIGEVVHYFGTGSARFYTDSSSHLYTYGSNKYSQMPNITTDGTDETVLPTRIYASVK